MRRCVRGLARKLRCHWGSLTVAPQGQIGRVVRAQQIAVRQQHACALQLHDLILVQQTASGRRREPLAHQEVPVALHEEARNAAALQRRQRFDDRAVAGMRVIVSDPDLEEIPENIERLGLHGVTLDKLEELPDASGAAPSPGGDRR